MTAMASGGRVLVESSLLCFIVNKWHFTAVKPLKELVLDFYSPEDISRAKELLFLELDSLKIDKEVKLPRRRRDSVNKPGMKTLCDIDDISFQF